MWNVLITFTITSFYITIGLHGEMILMLGIFMCTEANILFYDMFTLEAMKVLPFYCYWA